MIKSDLILLLSLYYTAHKSGVADSQIDPNNKQKK